MAGIVKAEARKIGEQVASLILDRLDQIDTAYLKFSDETFKLSFTTELKPDKRDPDGINLKTDISFNPEPKVKDSTSCTMNNRQKTLDDEIEETRRLSAHRLSPRYLIDMTSRPHCQSGVGPWCTLKAPCYVCLGLDRANFITFNERYEKLLEASKIREQTKPAPKVEHKGRMKGAASA